LEKIMERLFDLEERLLNYAASIILEKLPATRVGNHVSHQLLRAGTSPLPNHGEAEAAESRDDFIHKISICLKELRESRRWLRLIDRAKLLPDRAEVQPVLSETEELIKIFATSRKTARSNRTREED
jgi:four helix bundle protein